MYDYMDEGIELFEAGRYSEAIQCLSMVSEDDHNYFIALDMKGTALMFMGRFAESLEALDEAINLYPDWAEKDNVYANKANTLSMMHRFPEAIEYYQKSLEINPENQTALKNIGMNLVIIQKPQEALTYLDKFLEINRENFDAYQWKGEALMALNKYEEALNAYDMSLIYNPRNEDAIDLRKQALIKLNRNPIETSNEWVERGSMAMIFTTVDNILYCFDKAIELDPTNETAWIYKGNILLTLKNPDNSPNFKNIGDALNCYNIALELNPDNDEVFYYMTDAMLYLGRLEEAMKFCLTGLERCGNSDKLWAKQGVIMLKINRLNDAEDCFKTALQINPDNFEAKQGLEQLW